MYFVNKQSISWPGDRGKSAQSKNRRLGQEKVFGTFWLDRRSILFLDPQENSPETWRRIVFLCQQCYSSHFSNNGISLPGEIQLFSMFCSSSRSLCFFFCLFIGAPRGRFLFVHRLFRWERLWTGFSSVISNILKYYFVTCRN